LIVQNYLTLKRIVFQIKNVIVMPLIIVLSGLIKNMKFYLFVFMLITHPILIS